MDIVSKDVRSRMMSGIGPKDTKPEIRVRKYLHNKGFRFRLHRRDLPGKPDVVMPKHRTCVFVHGCFWHRHDCKYGKHLPKSNVDFWAEKLEANRKRDRKNVLQLEELGWKVIIIWECQTKTWEDIEEGLHSLGKISLK